MDLELDRDQTISLYLGTPPSVFPLLIVAGGLGLILLGVWLWRKSARV
jgi:threonine/homoserine/homoserine lactone efflux protein